VGKKENTEDGTHAKSNIRKVMGQGRERESTVSLVSPQQSPPRSALQF